MPATLPIGISFNLPSEEWVSADPDAAGLADAAFVAFRAAPGDYAPVLSVAGGYRDDPATLVDIGDEAVRVRRAEVGPTAQVILREEAESGQSPGLLQILRFQLAYGQRTFSLNQAQVVLAVNAQDGGSRRRVVLILAMTCEEEQLSALLPEFRAFVESIVPVNPDTPHAN
jgi:hypothetical protein